MKLLAMIPLLFISSVYAQPICEQEALLVEAIYKYRQTGKDKAFLDKTLSNKEWKKEAVRKAYRYPLILDFEEKIKYIANITQLQYLDCIVDGPQTK